jgi:Tfp pilus assembly protein PilN
MEAVNLLPAYARPGRRWATAGKDVPARHVLSVGGAVACVAVIGLGLGYVHERSVVNDRRATLADIKAQVAAADAKAAPLRAAQAAVAARLAAAGTISAKRIVWEDVLADISRVLPSQVYLQSLQAQSATPFASGTVAAAPTTQGGATMPVAAPTAFVASGVASSQVRVALVLDRLALLPWLSNVTLQSSSSHAAPAAGGASPSIAAGDTFSVNAVFNASGGAK